MLRPYRYQMARGARDVGNRNDIKCERKRVLSFPLDEQRGHEMLTIHEQQQLPALGFTIRDVDAMAIVRFLEPAGRMFYATEFDGRDQLYGYSIPDGWSFRSLSALARAVDADGQPAVHRDEFEARPIREILSQASPAFGTGTRITKLADLPATRHPSGDPRRFRLHLGR